MASKRIIKFVLKIAVVVGIIAGIYFGVSAINNKKNAHLRIIEASQSAQITTKINQSYDELVAMAQTNSLQKSMAARCKDITTVLMQYYKHYVNITCFENEHDQGKKDAIISKINSLSKAIDETAARLENAKKITNNDTEKNKRFIKTLEAYFEQTKILFEVDELLKDYVYKVSYCVESTGIAYEAQLEMVKDYAKVVFNRAIYGKQEATSLPTNEQAMITNNTEETGFMKVIYKFLHRSSVATNSDVEVYFAQYYMTIDKESLQGMYEKFNGAEKTTYINGFTDETLKLNLQKVYNYMVQENY